MTRWSLGSWTFALAFASLAHGQMQMNSSPTSSGSSLSSGSSFGSSSSLGSSSSGGGFLSEQAGSDFATGGGSLRTSNINGSSGDVFQQSRGDPLAIGRNSGATTQRTSPSNGQRRSANSSNLNNRSRAQRRATTQGGSVIRPVIRVAFTPAPPVHPTIVARSAVEPITPATIAGVREPNVRFDNGTAVLTGTVASTEEARLAAAILSLEPGVRSIRNEMVVRPGPAAP